MLYNSLLARLLFGARFFDKPNDQGSISAEEIKGLADDMKEIILKAKPIAEKATEELKAMKAMSEDTKRAADDALTTMNKSLDEKVEKFTKSMETRFAEVEQKAVRRGGGENQEGLKTLGQHVVDSENFKSNLKDSASRGKAQVSIETKTILSGTGSWGSTASVGNSLVMPQRADMVPLPQRQMTIRDLFSPGQTISNAIEYAIQVARTNNAAVVAENTLKPSSNYTWDLRSYPVRTVAHLIKASRQILDDAPGLRSIIDAEMTYGLQLAEEAELLNGDGTGAHILGVIPQATAYSGAFAVTDETAIDRIRLAMLQGVLALLPMTGTVLNPTDWAKIEMLKDGMGRYLIGDPQGQIQKRLWGIPVVDSLAMTANNFLTGAFKSAGQIFDRMAIEILISTENNDDFEKNMITIRAEERLALVIKRPAAFITGTLP